MSRRGQKTEFHFWELKKNEDMLNQKSKPVLNVLTAFEVYYLFILLDLLETEAILTRMS